jgi:hypothetical protein
MVDSPLGLDVQDVVDSYLNKVVEKQSDTLALTSMKMKRLPDISAYTAKLQCLTSLNLAKNNLFNGEELFQVRVRDFAEVTWSQRTFGYRTTFRIRLHCISWPCLTQALSKLELLTQLNLSENFLNGPLSEHAGKLTRLEVINLDINNITVLCPEVRNWTALRIFTISDNSLSGE